MLFRIENHIRSKNSTFVRYMSAKTVATEIGKVRAPEIQRVSVALDYHFFVTAETLTDQNSKKCLPLSIVETAFPFVPLL